MILLRGQLDVPGRRQAIPVSFCAAPTGMALQGFADRDNYPCEDIPVEKSLFFAIFVIPKAYIYVGS